MAAVTFPKSGQKTRHSPNGCGVSGRYESKINLPRNAFAHFQSLIFVGCRVMPIGTRCSTNSSSITRFTEAATYRNSGRQIPNLVVGFKYSADLENKTGFPKPAFRNSLKLDSSGKSSRRHGSSGLKNSSPSKRSTGTWMSARNGNQIQDLPNGCAPSEGNELTVD